MVGQSRAQMNKPWTDVRSICKKIYSIFLLRDLITHIVQLCRIFPIYPPSLHSSLLTLLSTLGDWQLGSMEVGGGQPQSSWRQKQGQVWVFITWFPQHHYWTNNLYFLLPQFVLGSPLLWLTKFSLGISDCSLPLPLSIGAMITYPALFSGSGSVQQPLLTFLSMSTLYKQPFH
jgi:hypothetical protein